MKLTMQTAGLGLALAMVLSARATTAETCFGFYEMRGDTAYAVQAGMNPLGRTRIPEPMGCGGTR